jgi:energy-coupling factor transporter ATP-binding protein EcfA2
MFSNPQLQLAYDFIQYTNKALFLTGKAGTGKTTFLHQLKKISPKRMAVVAPTGVAAINAGGVTIHSFFQMSFGPQISTTMLQQNMNSDSYGLMPAPSSKKFNKEKIRLIQSLDLLVIDEISMVRSDMLDAIDEVLRKYKDRTKPFGGVQLLMIGDLHQLSPVIKDEEWSILRDYYDTVYFFGSRALQKTTYVTIELSHIYRQSDKIFIGLLNKVRTKTIDEQALEELNKRYIPSFKPNDDEGYIVLTTHNASAAEINHSKLNQNKNTSHFFKAEIDGDYPSYAFPTDTDLELKVDAQVMFVKNDSSREKLFYNGKIGKVTRFDDDIIYVKCPADADEIPVNREEWQNLKFTLDENTKEVTETIIGTFVQFPLKLAWAITIHKSQGLTFEKAIIDAQASFAHGQVYVALSRCRSIEGLVLSTRVTMNSIRTDSAISDFSEKAKEHEPGEKELLESKIEFQQSLLLGLFDFSGTERLLRMLKKICTENNTIINASVINEISSTEQLTSNELFSIAGKFRMQLQQLFHPDEVPEQSAVIQERVRKAATYFLEKTDKILFQFTSDLVIETDNKAVKKLINEALEKLQLEVFIKQSCIKSCLNGFVTLNLLKVKSNAEIDFKTKVKTPKAAKTVIPKDIPHPELYSMIKDWRKETAADLNVSAFMVLHQKYIFELLEKLPQTLDELAGVKGFGKAKTKKFGNEILEIISEYCNNKGIERVSEVLTEPPEKKKTEKISSRKLSLDLFCMGKSISEIAVERQYAESTIEGHLAYYIGSGDLNIQDVLPKEKIDLIRDFFIENNTASIGAAKASLGDSVSYSEINFVVRHLQHQSKFE